MSDVDTIVREEIDTSTTVVMKRPSMFNVVLYNDDKTTMEFVNLILMSIFQKSFEEATALTFNIHDTGRGIAGTYPNEIAVQKRNDTIVCARTAGFPLECEVEEA